MYTWMVLQHPTNTSSGAERAEHLKLVSSVFYHYLASTGPFSKWPGEQAEYKIQLVGLLSHVIIHYLIHLQDNGPIAVWKMFESFGSPRMHALPDFADHILKIVVNQAGCERVFSNLKVKQTQ